MQPKKSRPLDEASPLIPKDNNQVHSWAESDLAWDLVDAISPTLPSSECAKLYAAIGSGESYSAITTMLCLLVRDALPLSAKLIAELSGWLNAYEHSADAPRLHELLSLIKSRL
ncbi:hypothetical protein [Mycobacterium intracellulare]|uniref:hypothetical protein n=1 Tax=Mycobacterium intracellulare TaxID=1767 RepID=UPI0034D408ED